MINNNQSMSNNPLQGIDPLQPAQNPNPQIDNTTSNLATPVIPNTPIQNDNLSQPVMPPVSNDSIKTDIDTNTSTVNLADNSFSLPVNEMATSTDINTNSVVDDSLNQNTSMPNAELNSPMATNTDNNSTLNSSIDSSIDNIISNSVSNATIDNNIAEPIPSTPVVDTQFDNAINNQVDSMVQNNSMANDLSMNTLEAPVNTQTNNEIQYNNTSFNPLPTESPVESKIEQPVIENNYQQPIETLVSDKLPEFNEPEVLPVNDIPTPIVENNNEKSNVDYTFTESPSPIENNTQNSTVIPALPETKEEQVKTITNSVKSQGGDKLKTIIILLMIGLFAVLGLLIGIILASGQ